MLKVILFAYMITGSVSTRKIEKMCVNDIRFRWLLQNENTNPTHMTICNFMNNYLKDNIENILNEINQYAADMDCFIPLMKKFKSYYDFYPEYPIADAEYGSQNNYIFCEQNNIKKYMKFPMYKKETTDKQYHDDIFRPINFKKRY